MTIYYLGYETAKKNKKNKKNTAQQNNIYTAY